MCGSPLPISRLPRVGLASDRSRTLADGPHRPGAKGDMPLPSWTENPCTGGLVRRATTKEPSSPLET